MLSSTHCKDFKPENVGPNQMSWANCGIEVAQNQQYILCRPLPLGGVPWEETETMVNSFTPIFDIKAHWEIGDMAPFAIQYMTSLGRNPWDNPADQAYAAQESTNPLTPGKTWQQSIGLASSQPYRVSIQFILPISGRGFGLVHGWHILKTKSVTL